jgi:hypothetical protein
MFLGWLVKFKFFIPERSSCGKKIQTYQSQVLNELSYQTAVAETYIFSSFQSRYTVEQFNYPIN